MNDFSYMKETVDKICYSLENEYGCWEFSPYTFKKKDGKVRFWSEGDSFVEIWNGNSTDIVFSFEQGKRIKNSYLIARQKQASQAQLKVIQEFNKENKEGEKKWWMFWK